MSEEKPLLSKQLREFQSKIKPLKKVGNNPHFKSSFARHEDVFEYFQPILAAAGLSMHQKGRDTDGMFYLITVIENDFGESRESEWPVCESKLEHQKKAAATTLISRHSVMRMLGLSATDDDHDGNDITQETPTQNNLKAPVASEAHHQETSGGNLMTIEALVKYEDRSKAKTAGFTFDKVSKKWLKQISVDDKRQYPFDVTEIMPL